VGTAGDLAGDAVHGCAAQHGRHTPGTGRTTIDDIAALPRFLVGGHPALRTRFLVDDELRDAMGRGELTWDAPPIRRNERLYLSIDDRPDRMDYSIGVDTRYFSRADTEALVRGMESLLVENAVTRP
jgi:hypothetical protein